MIKAIHFKNFKALRDTTLPLGQLTLLIGPNGSGKTTALDALTIRGCSVRGALTAAPGVEDGDEILIEMEWGGPFAGIKSTLRGYDYGPTTPFEHGHDRATNPREKDKAQVSERLDGARVYSFQADMLAKSVILKPAMELVTDGRGLAGVLDRLRDDHPERFDALNNEFAKWIPEFDRILFDTPQEGRRALKFRTRQGQRALPAGDISAGTLLALGILTLAYLPDPPPIIGLEEPGRGIHPRLMRDVRDAIYRLAYPESVGEDREPVQVVATTHSPYLVDLFRDHPEEIVIADKLEDNVRFTRLTDIPHYEEIIADATLGEVWYNGALGGVPAHR